MIRFQTAVYVFGKQMPIFDIEPSTNNGIRLANEAHRSFLEMRESVVISEGVRKQLFYCALRSIDVH